MSWNNFVKQNSGKEQSGESWEKKKKAYFNKNVMPKLSDAPDDEVVQLFKDFNTKADKDILVSKPVVKVEEKSLPTPAPEKVINKVPGKSEKIGRGTISYDPKTFAGMKPGESQAVKVEPEKAVISKEEADFRKTQRGIGTAVKEGVKGSVLSQLLTDPDILKANPLTHSIGTFLEVKQASDRLRKVSGKQTEEEKLYDKYGYQPGSSGEKVASGIAGITADLPVFATIGKITGGSQPAVFGGHSFLGSYLEAKKRGFDKGFDDFKNITEETVKGVVTGQVFKGAGMLGEKFGSKVAGRIAKANESKILQGAGRTIRDAEKIGQRVTQASKFPLEVGAFEVTKSALHGEAPTLEGLLVNAFTIAGLKATHAPKKLFDKSIRKIVGVVETEATHKKLKLLWEDVNKGRMTPKEAVDIAKRDLFPDRINEQRRGELKGEEAKVYKEFSEQRDKMINKEIQAEEFKRNKGNVPEKRVEKEVIEPDVSKIKPKRIERDVSEKTTMAIDSIVESQKKNIDVMLKDKGIAEIELMDSFDRVPLKGLNEVQKKSAISRAEEKLKKEYGLTEEKTLEQEFESMFDDYNNTVQKKFTEVKNEPISESKYNEMVSDLSKSKKYNPIQKAVLTGQAKARMKRMRAPVSEKEAGLDVVKQEVDKILNPKVIGAKNSEPIKDLFRLKKGDEIHSIAKHRHFKEANIEALGLDGEIKIDKLKNRTDAFGIPIFKSEVAMMKGFTKERFQVWEKKARRTAVGRRLQDEKSEKTFQPASHVLSKDIPAELKAITLDKMNQARTNEVIEIDKFHKDIKSNLKGLNKASKKRVAIHLYSEQKEAHKTLGKMKKEGKIEKSEIKFDELNIEERQAVKWIRGEMKTFFKRVNATRLLVGLKPIEATENYFTFARRFNQAVKKGLDPVVADPKIWNKDTDVNLKATAYDSAKLRTDNIIDLDLNLERTLNNYSSSTLKHINMSPVIAKARGLLDLSDGDWSFKNDNPHAYNYMNRWLNDIAGRKLPTNMPEWFEKTINKATSNVGVAILAYNLRSAFVQPQAIGSTIAEFGGAKTMQGVKDTFVRPEFAKENSKILKSRSFDVTAGDVAQSMGGTLKGKVADKGTWLLRYLDGQAAMTHWFSAYRDAKSKGVPENKAFIFADDSVVNAHSSGDPIHRAPVQRSTLGKALTIFQTYTINQLQWAKRDVLGVGNKKVTPKDALTRSLRLLSFVALSNTMMEAMGMNPTFPAPATTFYKHLVSGDSTLPWQVLGDKNPEYKDNLDASLDVLHESMQMFPVVGGTRFGGAGLGGAVGQTLTNVGDAFKDRRYEKLGWELGKLAGVPGLSQIKKTVRAYNRETESTKDRRKRLESERKKIKKVRKIKRNPKRHEREQAKRK